MTKPFYQTRLSDGRKIELDDCQYAAIRADIREAMGDKFPTNVEAQKKLVREYLELGGHLKAKSFVAEIPYGDKRGRIKPTKGI